MPRFPEWAVRSRGLLGGSWMTEGVHGQDGDGPGRQWLAVCALVGFADVGLCRFLCHGSQFLDSFQPTGWRP